MDYKRAVHALNRSELQRYAKIYGIRANQKTTELRDILLEKTKPMYPTLRMSTSGGSEPRTSFREIMTLKAESLGLYITPKKQKHDPYPDKYSNSSPILSSLFNSAGSSKDNISLYSNKKFRDSRDISTGISSQKSSNILSDGENVSGVIFKSEKLTQKDFINTPSRFSFSFEKCVIQQNISTNSKTEKITKNNINLQKDITDEKILKTNILVKSVSTNNSSDTILSPVKSQDKTSKINKKNKTTKKRKMRKKDISTIYNLSKTPDKFKKVPKKINTPIRTPTSNSTPIRKSNIFKKRIIPQYILLSDGLDTPVNNGFEKTTPASRRSNSSIKTPDQRRRSKFASLEVSLSSTRKGDIPIRRSLTFSDDEDDAAESSLTKSGSKLTKHQKLNISFPRKSTSPRVSPIVNRRRTRSFEKESRVKIINESLLKSMKSGMTKEEMKQSLTDALNLSVAECKKTKSTSSIPIFIGNKKQNQKKSYFTKSHQSEFNKMDSISEYLLKKQSRANDLLNPKISKKNATVFKKKALPSYKKKKPIPATIKTPLKSNLRKFDTPRTDRKRRVTINPTPSILKTPPPSEPRRRGRPSMKSPRIALFSTPKKNSATPKNNAATGSSRKINSTRSSFDLKKSLRNSSKSNYKKHFGKLDDFKPIKPTLGSEKNAKIKRALNTKNSKRRKISA